MQEGAGTKIELPVSSHLAGMQRSIHGGFCCTLDLRSVPKPPPYKNMPLTPP